MHSGLIVFSTQQRHHSLETFGGILGHLVAIFDYILKGEF